MESPNPTFREQGLQALREGNLDGAVDFLARAVMADAQDTESQAFLGVAYSQKGMHAQAVRALQTAVELRPNEPRYRFNLGVALENGGDPTGAASAYQETLRLNPEHSQARSKLQALGATPPAPSPTSPGAATSAPPSPWAAGAQDTSTSTGPPGSVQCPSCKQWSKLGLSCEWCSSPLSRATSGSTAPWLQGSQRPVTEEVESGAPVGSYVEDRFDIGQALKDWVRTVISPARFFRDQAGREGLKAPLAFLLIYNLIYWVISLVSFQRMGSTFPMSGTPFLIGFVFIGIPLSVLLTFLWAAIVHGVCRMFGGQAGYSGSFRAVIYPLGPLLVISTLSSLILLASGPQPARVYGSRGLGQAAPQGAELRFARAPVPVRSASSGHTGVLRLAQYGARPGYRRRQPGGAPLGAAAPVNPFAAMPPATMALGLLGMVYYLVLMGVGVQHIHQVSGGSAAGVAIVSFIAAIVLYILFVVIIGVAFVALLGGMRGAAR